MVGVYDCEGLDVGELFDGGNAADIKSESGYHIQYR